MTIWLGFLLGVQKGGGMKASSHKEKTSFLLYGLGVSPRRYLPLIGLLLLVLLACTDTRAEKSEDFAVIFRCEKSPATSCLVGEVPSGQRVALVSTSGTQCQAFTKDSFKYEGPTDWIPATRLDTTACGQKDLAFAVLSQKKGALHVEPLQEIVDKDRISALRQRVSSNRQFRFNERKYREDNPVALNDERNEWQNRFDYVKSYYDSFSGPPTVYRVSAAPQETFLLRYLWAWAGSTGPVVLMTRGRLQLLEEQGSSFITFALGKRKYLFLRWNKGEGGYHGTSIRELDDKGGREVFRDASFST